MLTRPRQKFTFMITVALASVAVACSNDTTTAPGTSLANLTLVGVDSGTGSGGSTGGTGSGGSTGGTTAGNGQPGYFRGRILGSVQNPGNDSLTAAPALADVRVAIAARRVGASGALEAGPELGAATTNQNGEFQLPTVPAGEYVVTFLPPQSSLFDAGYSVSPLDGNSSSRPWTVVLRRK